MLNTATNDSIVIGRNPKNGNTRLIINPENIKKEMLKPTEYKNTSVTEFLIFKAKTKINPGMKII